MDMLTLCKSTKSASRTLALTTSDGRNRFLTCLAELLHTTQSEILAANAVDLKAGGDSGLSPALLDRLMLSPARLGGMAADLEKVKALPDPVGEVFESRVLENGLKVRKVRVPLGVLAAIYESRPNVTVDIASLAIKSGNAVILKGGREALASNAALVRVTRQALIDSELPEGAIQFISDPERSTVLELLQMDAYIDMVIPRGSAALHEFLRKNSRIPVITGGIGICHLFVDASADLGASIEVIHNAKVQRPSVCNALDTVLVHREVAAALLPGLAERLGQSGVELRTDAAAWAILGEASGVKVNSAGPQDFDTEWLSLVLGIRVVDGLEEAVAHIAAHSTGHSDGILTQDAENAARFVSQVDSAAVYVNASTRFTDGSQLGLGAEVAISTQRLHARGPMGLRELMTYKWVIEGDYSVRP
jgi:glutamate-5-semialdehyde dehydrogenase